MRCFIYIFYPATIQKGAYFYSKIVYTPEDGIFQPETCGGTVDKVNDLFSQ